jgi:hypothetical protein
MKPGHVAGLQLTKRDAGRSYFFTHVLVVLSHFMSVSFLQSAFVVGAVAVAAFAAGAVGAAGAATGGASAANAGAVNAIKRPATIAVLKILTDMLKSSPCFLGHPLMPKEAGLSFAFLAVPCPALYSFVKRDEGSRTAQNNFVDAEGAQNFLVNTKPEPRRRDDHNRQRQHPAPSKKSWHVLADRNVSC